MCSAYYLSKRGHDVTIVERSSSPAGCSYGNCGMMVPSHFTPLASPGIVAKGLRWMLSNKSPFYIRPRMDMDLFRWGLRFLRSANENNSRKSSGLILEMNLESRKLYQEMIHSDFGEVDINLGGLVMYCKTEKAFNEELAAAQKAKEIGLKIRVLENSDLPSFEPGINIDVLGGVHYLDDGFLEPEHFMERLKEHLEKSGVKILYNAEVTGFETSGSELTSIDIDNQKYHFDQVVIAAGSWSGEVLKRLNLKLPIQGGKGYSFVVRNHSALLKTCCILVEGKVAITPFESGIRFGGTMEIAGTDLSIDKQRVQGIRDSVTSCFPDFKNDHMESLDIWSGLRPVPADGVPYMGRLSNYKNVIVATGHGMMGFSLGPVSGKMVSNIVEEEATGYDDQLLHPERFS